MSTNVNVAYLNEWIIAVSLFRQSSTMTETEIGSMRDGRECVPAIVLQRCVVRVLRDSAIKAPARSVGAEEVLEFCGLMMPGDAAIRER